MSPKMKTIIDSDGKRYHLFGTDKVECNASRFTEDCQLCQRESIELIKKWIEEFGQCCLMCNEKPFCYTCLRGVCVDWCADKAYIEEFGTLRGCKRLLHNSYCSDFTCKHKLQGWWVEGNLEHNRKIFPELYERLYKQKVAKINKAKG